MIEFEHQSNIDYYENANSIYQKITPMTEVIIDLGEDGMILIDAADGSGQVAVESPTEKVGMFSDAAGKVGKTVKIAASEVLKLPLTGIAKCFLASLPRELPNDSHELDEFSLEFNVGIKSEKGVDAGIFVAKIMPEGGFKCTYKWKRKAVKTNPSIVNP